MNESILKWWDSLLLIEKFDYTIPYLNARGKNVCKHPSEFSDEEIIEIYNERY